MKETWRLIDTGSNNGFYNMAVDEAIAIACREGIAPPTLRFYTWNHPCISIGYFQEVDKVLNMQGVDKDTMTIVRRITGGRAVFHGNDLCYSVACKIDNELFPRSIMGAYYIIADAFAAGIKSIGITPDPFNLQHTKGRTKRYHHSTLCFATTLGHEISVNGKKLIGSAQRRWSDVFLQQGSILITGSSPENSPLTHPSRHFSPLGGEGKGEGFSCSFVPRRDMRVSSGNGCASTSLSEILGDKPDIKSIVSALATGFRNTLRINLAEGELTGREIELAGGLIEKRYSHASWNTSSLMGNSKPLYSLL